MSGDGPASGDSNIDDRKIGDSSIGNSSNGANDDGASDGGRTDGDAPSPPACPHCGERMTWLTVVGPGEGYASPCGCSVEPGLLANFRED